MQHTRTHPGAHTPFPPSIAVFRPPSQPVLISLAPRRLGLQPEVVEAARAGLDTSMSVADSTIKDLEHARVRLGSEETARFV